MPEDKKLIFTPSLFVQHSVCPHWIYRDRFEDPEKRGELSELAEKIMEQGVLHEKEYIEDLEYEEVEFEDPDKAFEETIYLMEEGADLIYQGAVTYEEDGVVYRGRPDLMKKYEGVESRFGDYCYIPIDIKSSKRISREQSMQLALYGMILDRVQNKFPPKLAIINREKEELAMEVDSKVREKTKRKISEILNILRGQKPPLKLTSTCSDSPWGDLCVKEAEEEDDIALIYKLDSRAHEDLRNEGIETVHDAAEMDVESIHPKISYASKKTLKRVKKQAQSLVEDKLFWTSNPEVPDAPLKIYFDIEGDPLMQIEYLFGFWVVGDPDGRYATHENVRWNDEGDKYFLYFLAEKPEEEEGMWNRFLSWLEDLPDDDYLVYHYANYEKTRTGSMAEDYGSSEGFENFYERLFDLAKVVKDSVIMPLYFYSIKDVAKSRFVDYKWSHKKAGGAQSIFWYEKWIETGDREVLNDIIDYNEDDVKATERLHEWLDENSD